VVGFQVTLADANEAIANALFAKAPSDRTDEEPDEEMSHYLSLSEQPEGEDFSNIIQVLSRIAEEFTRLKTSHLLVSKCLSELLEVDTLKQRLKNYIHRKS
jgi:hypothetical protein